jgi:hypothetical protein
MYTKHHAHHTIIMNRQMREPIVTTISKDTKGTTIKGKRGQMQPTLQVRYNTLTGYHMIRNTIFMQFNYQKNNAIVAIPLVGRERRIYQYEYIYIIWM